MFCKYECGYGPEDHYENPNHMRSIKHGYLAHFSIRRFYTWPDVVEIIFYRQIHTQANGDLAHSACDPRSTLWMSAYVSCMSYKLKEFIWTQLGLKYTVKQIYDKHIEIWWAWTNVGEWMTRMISHDPKILPTWNENTTGALGTCTHKPDAFHWIMGLCSSWWCFLFPRCKWSGISPIPPRQ